MRHRGFYPLTDVDLRLRQRMESLFEGPQLPDRAARLAGLKQKLLDMLAPRRDPNTGELIIAFQSDQYVIYDETLPQRDWEYSQLDTAVQENGRAEITAFLNTPMRTAQPNNSQVYKSDIVHPAAFEA